MMKEYLFILFSLLTIVAAGGVVLSRNAVYSAFNLILSFFGLSVLYLLWGAPFLAVIQILVYTGAIVVLFVFVVMLLNFRQATYTPGQTWIGVMGAGVAWFLSLIFLRILAKGMGNTTQLGSMGDLREVSKLLFTRYLWPFEVLSFFLLVMIIASFALTRENARAQSGETK